MGIKTHLTAPVEVAPILTRCGLWRSGVSRVADRGRVDCTRCLKFSAIDEIDIAAGQPVDWRLRLK